MKKLEVGNVYRHTKTDRLYLAVSVEALLIIVNGRSRTVGKLGPFSVARGVSVDTLCKTWGTSTGLIDQIFATYLNPEASRNVGVRQRISRADANHDPLLQARLLRIHRIGL